jgi:hypothetical protein
MVGISKIETVWSRFSDFSKHPQIVEEKYTGKLFVTILAWT